MPEVVCVEKMTNPLQKSRLDSKRRYRKKNAKRISKYIKQYMKKYRAKNPEKFKLYNRKKAQQRKKERKEWNMKSDEEQFECMWEYMKNGLKKEKEMME